MQILKDLLIKDICAYYTAEAAYLPYTKRFKPTDLFPISFYERCKSSASKQLFSKSPDIEIDLATVPSLVMPWKSGRFVKNLRTISEFKYNADNHKGFWFESLSLAVIYQGNHSCWAGINKCKQAKVILQTLHDEILLNEVKTDGVNWLIGDKKEEIKDFRIPVLFWVQSEMQKLM